MARATCALTRVYAVDTGSPRAPMPMSKMKTPNLDTIEKHTGRVITELMAGNVRRATAFINSTFVISAARRFRPRKTETRMEAVIKIGRPNFAEREFIKLCQKSGTAFPLRNVQLKFFEAKTRKR